MKKHIIVALIAVVLLTLAGFQLRKNYAKNTTQSLDVALSGATVSVVDVVRNDVSLPMTFTGTVYPIRELDIAAETAGKITSLQFNVGRQVQRGSVLAIIDDEVKRLAYERAKLDADKLKKDYARTQNLFNGGTASEQEVDNARASYETAKTRLDEAEKQYADTKITSPIGGVITDRKIEEGTYVNPGTPVASVVDISRLKVKLRVSETNVYNLRQGDKVTVTSDVYPGIDLAGTITFVSPRGDDAHNYPVEIEMPNNVQHPLKGGTFVQVNFTRNFGRNGLFIPREALQGSIKDAKVFVAENGKAWLKAVTIGESRGDMLEVTAGLRDGDKIITTGQVNLADGKSISIINNK